MIERRGTTARASQIVKHNGLHIYPAKWQRAIVFKIKRAIVWRKFMIY